MANYIGILGCDPHDLGMDTSTDSIWDCVVVGGGAAGLSAALVLGRARRRTLVVDAGNQSNRVAERMGGLLGHDGVSPAALYATGRQELAAYRSVELRTGQVRRGERRDDGLFVLEMDDGSRHASLRVVLAAGMAYDYLRPDLPGMAERWGRSVFHCPFCHGWEVRDRALGVLDGSPSGVRRALLLRMWSDDVTLLADGPAELGAEERERLRAAGVAVDERPVVGLRGPGDTLTAVVFADGDERPCGGLLVSVTLRQRSRLAEQLGAVAAPPGPVAADAPEVDPLGQTSVPGLFAAGDLTGRMPSVANAIASGSAAAAGVVHSLADELLHAHEPAPTGA
jgi:thioredoxin reductase